MTSYRRFYLPEATWFFTVNLVERHNNHLLVEHIDALRSAFSYVKRRKPFTMEAVVIMPDHLHTIWRLPPNDADYSSRWSLVKSHFSRAIPCKERVSESRKSRRERGIWQRRYWAHLLTSQEDFNNHCDYIHWNPVKHGHATKVADWPYSSFHRYVAAGIYPAHWDTQANLPFMPTNNANDALRASAHPIKGERILWPCRGSFQVNHSFQRNNPLANLCCVALISGVDNISLYRGAFALAKHIIAVSV